jgi:rhodanese-related sulfurtransferase
MNLSRPFFVHHLCIFAFWIGVISAQEVLTPDLFYAGMQNGDFNAVIDVRSESEWSSVGHIDNATLVADLASSGVPDKILGCKDCTIAVYCNSGFRAGQAIGRLQTVYGFTGTLYNAQGVTQWDEAGYPLVSTDSTSPPCAASECESCSADCVADAPTKDDDSGARRRGVDTMRFTVLFLSVLGMWFI